MGFFSRIGRVIKANVNAMLDAAEDPEKTMEQLIREMKEAHVELRERVTEARVEARKKERALEKAQKVALDWKLRAESAVRAGDEELAKAALAKRRAADGEVKRIEMEQDQHDKALSSLEMSLEAVQNKIKEAEQKKSVLITQMRIAETKMGLSSSTSKDVPRMQAFQEFDRIIEGIRDKEDRAEVMLEMAEVESSLQDDSIPPPAPTDLDDELARLKAEMGLPDKSADSSSDESTPEKTSSEEAPSSRDESSEESPSDETPLPPL